MKKILILIVMIMLAQLLLGCTSDYSNDYQMIDGAAVVRSVETAASSEYYTSYKRYRVVVHSRFAGQTSKTLARWHKTVIYTNHAYIPGDTIRLQP